MYIASLLVVVVRLRGLDALYYFDCLRSFSLQML